MEIVCVYVCVVKQKNVFSRGCIAQEREWWKRGIKRCITTFFFLSKFKNFRNKGEMFDRSKTLPMGVVYCINKNPWRSLHPKRVSHSCLFELKDPGLSRCLGRSLLRETISFRIFGLRLQCCRSLISGGFMDEITVNQRQRFMKWEMARTTALWCAPIRAGAETNVGLTHIELGPCVCVCVCVCVCIWKWDSLMTVVLFAMLDSFTLRHNLWAGDVFLLMCETQTCQNPVPDTELNTSDCCWSNEIKKNFRTTKLFKKKKVNKQTSVPS